MWMNEVYFQKGMNDILYAEDGREYIDLHTGFGAVILGHSNPNITPVLKDQVNKVWTTARQASRVVEDAQEAIKNFLPPGLVPTVFGSSGLEAAEFALRISSVLTGRSSFIGFSNSMHGKSVATIALSWPNQFDNIPGFHRLPFLPEINEQEILGKLEDVLQAEAIAGVFIEPILGSSGGFSASTGFYQEVVALCRRFGTLSIFDEILTGYYRTGSRFCAEYLEVTPDILLSGKAVGNGFPVSITSLHERYSVTQAMLPGSTFSNNPLAASVVTATLREMGRIDMSARINAIEGMVRAVFADLEELGVVLRGRGGLWILELPLKEAGLVIAERCLKQGVLISASGEHFRILPAATIVPENLEKACNTVKRVCIEVLDRTVSDGWINVREHGE